MQKQHFAGSTVAHSVGGWVALVVRVIRTAKSDSPITAGKKYVFGDDANRFYDWKLKGPTSLDDSVAYRGSIGKFSRPSRKDQHLIRRTDFKKAFVNPNALKKTITITSAIQRPVVIILSLLSFLVFARKQIEFPH